MWYGRKLPGSMSAYGRRVNGFEVSKKVSQSHIEAENSEGVNQVRKEERASGPREECAQRPQAGRSSLNNLVATVEG